MLAKPGAEHTGDTLGSVSPSQPCVHSAPLCTCVAACCSRASFYFPCFCARLGVLAGLLHVVSCGFSVPEATGRSHARELEGKRRRSQTPRVLCSRPGSPERRCPPGDDGAHGGSGRDRVGGPSVRVARWTTGQDLDGGAGGRHRLRGTLCACPRGCARSGMPHGAGGAVRRSQGGTEKTHDPRGLMEPPPCVSCPCLSRCHPAHRVTGRVPTGAFGIQAARPVTEPNPPKPVFVPEGCCCPHGQGTSE